MSKLGNKSNFITTYRVGRPDGLFYGNRIRGPGGAVTTKLLPRTGPDVMTIKGTWNEGDASGAPLSDAVLEGKIPIPRDIIKVLESHDLQDLDWGLDLVGMLALKRRGVNVVHMPGEHMIDGIQPIVSVDMIHITLQQLERKFQDYLLPLHEGDSVLDLTPQMRVCLVIE